MVSFYVKQPNLEGLHFERYLFEPKNVVHTNLQFHQNGSTWQKVLASFLRIVHLSSTAEHVCEVCGARVHLSTHYNIKKNSSTIL